MFLSGLLPRPMCSDDDQKLLDFGIGFTNIVERTTRGSSALSRQEIVEGIFYSSSSNTMEAAYCDHFGIEID
jgi:hypothetical protein